MLPLELRRQLPELPVGVHVRDRELAIEYNSVEQLLQRLYELSQAAARDFEGFITVVEAPDGTAPEEQNSRPNSPA